MTDSCQRTGRPHSYWPQGNCQYCGEVSPVLTSLRSSLKEIREENDRLKADAEAMAKALEQIASYGTVAGMHPQDRDMKLQNIARSALADYRKERG